MKIFGIQFSYGKNLEQEKNFCKQIAKINKNAINVLLMKQHQIGGKSTVNNSPPVPKVIYRVLVIRLRCASIKQICKKKYLGEKKNLKQAIKQVARAMKTQL